LGCKLCAKNRSRFEQQQIRKREEVTHTQKERKREREREKDRKHLADNNWPKTYNKRAET